MLENRDFKQDLIALALLGGVIFVGLSLITYSPADPVKVSWLLNGILSKPDRLVFPQNSEITNACGRWGAYISNLLFSQFGLGAYFVIWALGVWDVNLLRRIQINNVVGRLIGGLLCVIGLTTLLSLIVPTLSPGPVLGSGGAVGTLFSAMLMNHFAIAGAVVLATSVFICGLFLFTDYAVIRWTQKLATIGAVAGLAVSSNSRIGEKLKQLRLLGRTRNEDSAEDEDSELKIRINRKKDDVSEIDREIADLEGDEEAENVDERELDETDESYDEEDAPVIKKKLPEKPKAEAAIVEAPTAEKASVNQPHFKYKKKPEEKPADDVISQLDEASQANTIDDYELPTIDLLRKGESFSYDSQEQEVLRKAKILEKTFAEFGFQIKVVEIETGPVIAQYEIQLEAGLRLSKITGLADDLAIALRVPSVRIVAPIPGKNTVGIEVPNETRQVVRLREVMEEAKPNVQKMKVPLFLGKDVAGNPLIVDLATMPHLLIAGRTGTGKSVCLNSIICSMLMTRRPDEVRMLMIDPKMVELSGYGRLPHLMHPVVTDMAKASAILAWAVQKMEERYALLARAGVRHITNYNQLGEEELMERLRPETEEEKQAIPLNLPFIVIVADEIADMMMTAGKDVEQSIIRLAQKSRAVGIHLILATQKPTVDVITGLIKSNLPARIAFQVASRTDSRVVLDENGADRLLGNGDMLFLWPGTSTLLRGQGTYVSDDEIESIVESVSQHGQNFVSELVNLKPPSDKDDEDVDAEAIRKRDELYEDAIEIVIREGRGSVSLLQRALGIGYGRAARLIDYMEEDGIVGAYNGSQAREVIITHEKWTQMMHGDGAAQEDAPPPKAAPKRSNKIRLEGEATSKMQSPAGKSPKAPLRKVEDNDTEERASLVSDEESEGWDSKWEESDAEDHEDSGDFKVNHFHEDTSESRTLINKHHFGVDEEIEEELEALEQEELAANEATLVKKPRGKA